MAYYQNGQHSYNQSAQPPYQQPHQLPNQYQDPRTYSSNTPGDGAHYGANGGAQDQYGYSAGYDQERRTSAAYRQHDELFMGGPASPQSQGTMSPSVGSFGQQYQPQSPSVSNPSYMPQQYNPSAFPQPLQHSSNQQAYGGGVNRSYTQSGGHAPYNPAAYSDSNLARQNTVSHPYGFSPTTYSTNAPIYQPSPPQPGYSPPTQHQQQQFPHRTTSVYGQTQNTQSPSFIFNQIPTTHQPTYTPPAPPPLPVVPDSNTSDWRGTSSSPQSGYSQYSRPPEDPHYSTQSPQYQTHPSQQNSQHSYYDEGRTPPFDTNHPLPPTPGPAPPPHGSPQRSDTTSRRPLPPPPPDDNDGEYFAQPNGGAHLSQDALFQDLENTLNSGHAVGAPHSPRIELSEAASPPENGDQYRQDSVGSGTLNGHLTPEAARLSVTEPQYSDESDAEAAAGLAAMEEAERQDEAARRRSGGSGLFSSYAPQTQSAPGGTQSPEHNSDSDYATMDMTALGGGYEPHFTYGGAPSQLAAGGSAGSPYTESMGQPLSQSSSLRRSGDTSETGDSYDLALHPFPSAGTTARVDAFGTGGFAEPTAAMRRRLSYDEGDEAGMIDDVGGTSGPPDMMYHPGMSTRRPLPPPPANQAGHAGSGGGYPRSYSDQTHTQQLRSGPESYSAYSINQPMNPRSLSLIQHSQPPTLPPARSKTDAEERRLRQQQIRTGGPYGNDSGTDTMTPPSASAMTLDLPSLPVGKRFNPQKLSANDYRKCAEPWALSAITEWLKKMTEGETDLKEQSIIDGLVALFTHKIATMNIADAEVLSARVVQDFYKAGTLVHEEEWLKFSSETTTGVIFQLTGTGCYAPKVHEDPIQGRCYAHHCQRTLKKIDLHATPSISTKDDWATFHKVKKEDVEKINPKEVERQNILHEVVQGEDLYMANLSVLQVLYRDGLMSAQPAVIPPKKIKQFLNDIFGKVDAVKQANEEHLLPFLKFRQQEQGPWITGFSDIFREWIRRAEKAYVAYAEAFPKATFLVRQEMERNMLFRNFLDQARNNKMSNKLSWDTFLKAPITRLQHYGLLLGTVLKRSTEDNQEKRNLEVAIEEIKAVTLQCDAKVAEMARQVDLRDLQSKLILRPGMQRVELNLDHLGRQLIYKGDLLRMGGTRYTWLDTHALLFDHYLILAKTVSNRDTDGSKNDKYDISKLPIPMDLLLLESRDDDAVMKSTVKGIQQVAAPAGRPSASPVPGLTHTKTNESLGSLNTVGSGKGTPVTDLSSPKDDKIMYPFRVKHLGKETYTLFAPTLANRDEWCDKIIEAKRRHAESLHRQNAEPFRLRVIADTAFAYEQGMAGQKPPTVKGTPLDRAIEEVERQFVNAGRPSPVCRAKVNCATSFSQPYPAKPMIAVGTDFGVYVSEVDNPRGWTRVIPIPRVTQVAVLEDFSLFILISDKSLIAYHLDVVLPSNGASTQGNDSGRKAPQKLSGNKDIAFFATGRMKDRMLIFYMKRAGLSSTFKILQVLEPVYQKSASSRSKSSLFKSSRTEFFREFDEFYIPTECYGINLYNSSLAVSTSKGFEVLTLDKKQPWSVPDLKAPHVASIAARLQGQETLGMFRLNEQEFLLCYEECAVYVNKHGDISRSVIMEFVGKAKSAALYGPYVLLFDPDFVEVRNAQNGRLRQVISGREVRCLDDGGGSGGAGGGKRSVKIGLSHPGYERMQILLELVINEGQTD